MKEIKLDDMTVTEVRSIALQVIDLQTAETVSSAVITHTPPSGSALTVPFSVSTPNIFMLFGPFGTVGRHIVKVQAIGSGAGPSKPETIFYIDVVTIEARRVA